MRAHVQAGVWQSGAFPLHQTALSHSSCPAKANSLLLPSGMQRIRDQPVSIYQRPSVRAVCWAEGPWDLLAGKSLPSGPGWCSAQEWKMRLAVMAPENGSLPASLPPPLSQLPGGPLATTPPPSLLTPRSVTDPAHLAPDTQGPKDTHKRGAGTCRDAVRAQEETPPGHLDACSMPFPLLHRRWTSEPGAPLPSHPQVPAICHSPGPRADPHPDSQGNDVTVGTAPQFSRDHLRSPKCLFPEVPEESPLVKFSKCLLRSCQLSLT